MVPVHEAFDHASRTGAQAHGRRLCGVLMAAVELSHNAPALPVPVSSIRVSRHCVMPALHPPGPLQWSRREKLLPSQAVVAALPHGGHACSISF